MDNNTLQIITHEVDQNLISQRIGDGYLNATLMCKACGKQWNDYSRLSSSKAFLTELSTETGIPVSGLVQIKKGGNDLTLQGTWVHPNVAINLGQWLSP